MATAGQEITDGTVVWRVIDIRGVAASSSQPGVLKLYDTTGGNTDGAMTQSAITAELNNKVTVGATVANATNATYATTAKNIPTSSGQGNIWLV